ncbi:MAG TPA: hypothetical protein PK559_14510 [Ignavibacteriaceae bacterium]|nr:hypothetical protein [Ignavibacteriaceae bacterium]
MDNKLYNALELYIESIEENYSDVKKKLQAENIDTSELSNKIAKMIAKKEGELRLQKGKQFKLEYLKLEADTKNKISAGFEYKIAAGFRNGDENSIESTQLSEDDKKKLSILDLARKDVFGGN